MSYQAQEWTVQGLATETKLDRRTVAKRLENVPPHRVAGKVKYWRGVDAFPALYAGKTPSADSQDEAERRKTNAEADIAEMKAGQMRGDLISVQAFAPVIDRAVAAARARLLAVAPKLAPVLRPDKPDLARVTIENAMLEAIAELQSMLDDEDAPAMERAA